MRFFTHLAFSLFFSFSAGAQQHHYIYIQTDNRQAFYVKLNEKIFSASAAGYLIIPALADGRYRFSIGFPKNEWPSQYIEISVQSKDQGFVLKNFDGKGWGLFNLQSMEVSMGKGAEVIVPPVTEDRTDAFSNTLAEVTNTPSIKQRERVDEQLQKTVSDSSIPHTEVVTEKEQTTGYGSGTKIKQVFSFIDVSGRSLIYSIDNGITVERVRLFIPYDKMDSADDKVNSSGNADSKTWGEVRAAEKDSSKVNTVSGNIEMEKEVKIQPVMTDVKPLDNNAATTNNYTVTILNPACKSTATVDDLSKLGKKMAAAGNDDDRISSGKKAFKTKCFTTDQVRNLASLFSTDEGRYGFFDAAYKHVSDVSNFKELLYQLTDEYYINRFKAMLR